MHHAARVRRRAPWRLAIVVVAALLGCALVVGAPRVGAADPPLAIVLGAQAPLPLAPPDDGALAGELRELAGAARGLGAAARGADLVAAVPAARAAVAAGRLRVDGDAVQVDIEWTGAGPPLAALAAAGARIEREDRAQRVVQARVPAAALEQLAAAAGVRRVRPPLYAHVRAGSRLTEGDALLGLGALRTTAGVDGSGVCVGAISDGVFGIDAAIASGNLPPTTLVRDGGGKLVGTTGGVIAQSFRADGDLEAGIGGPPARGAEGTALLEIVHDLAPGAQLRFANIQTHLDFNAAVNALAAVCDVVVDDIGFFGWPGDGTSPVSRNTAAALTSPANRVRAHVTAVGNEARDHYEDAYRADATDISAIFSGGLHGRLHRFEATLGTENRAGFGGPSLNNAFRVAARQSATVWLTWNDPIGGSANDYDMAVAWRDGSGNLAGIGGLEVQNGDDDPRESVFVTNETGVDAQFDVLIWNKNDAAAPRTLELFVHGALHNRYAGGAGLGWLTPGGSIMAQSDAGGGVLALGAVNASDPGVDDVASYSSRGPTNDGRLKPDAVAVDGVAISGAGGFTSPFFGTSAAAPHGAALAALLLQAHPRLRAGAPNAIDATPARSTLRALITDSAVDLGAVGADQLSGAGRIDGVRAGALVGPPQRLEFAVVPSGAAAGVPFAQQPVVRLVDGLGASCRAAACRSRSRSRRERARRARSSAARRP